MLHPTVFNTSEICHAYGVKHAVISPGSRNAPLTISFARNDKIKKYIIPDERSAGFIALGIAQVTASPVVLCCTSGTALLNYGPAIAEAYYRQIPLVVLSADRPPEWIDQRDGQTIRQFQALEKHIKISVQLPVVNDLNSSDSYQKLLQDALTQTSDGPVHINVPFSEPFYPSENQELKHFSIEPATKSDLVEIVTNNSLKINDLRKIIIVVGQLQLNHDFNNNLSGWEKQVPFLTYPLSNIRQKTITHADLFLRDQKQLQPELLITTGLSVLSKKLKQFLRTHKPKQHLHLDPTGTPVDTYQTDPELVKVSLPDFLRSHGHLLHPDPIYYQAWQEAQEKSARSLKEVMQALPYAEISAFYTIWRSVPVHYHVHLGNSMPVRFGEIFGPTEVKQYWSNRGTSGIDGTTSTALGSALATPDDKHVLITGDLAFLYDRNAFFHNHRYDNLRIIILNNHGGGIFRLIEGPSRLPELEEYFETRHNRTAAFVCRENAIDYFTADEFDSLRQGIEWLFDSENGPRLLEVFTTPEENEKVYKKFRSAMS